MFWYVKSLYVVISNPVNDRQNIFTGIWKDFTNPFSLSGINSRMLLFEAHMLKSRFQWYKHVTYIYEENSLHVSS